MLIEALTDSRNLGGAPSVRPRLSPARWLWKVAKNGVLLVGPDRKTFSPRRSSDESVGIPQ